MAETLVTVICNQLSNKPYSVRHRDLLVLNKSQEKKLQVKNNSFTAGHTEGFIMKANWLWLNVTYQESTKIVLILKLHLSFKLTPYFRREATPFGI